MNRVQRVRRTWVSHRVAWVAGTVAVVLVLGGGVAYAARSETGSYRTATVERGDVDQVLDLTGTIAASQRRDLAFGQSGTVESVDVEAGEEVESGDTLAALDTTDLEAALAEAESGYAEAVASLEDTEDSQTAVVADAAAGGSSGAADGGSSGDTSAGSTGGAAAPGTSAAVTEALARLEQQQTAVKDASTASTDALAVASAALETQQAACADPVTVTEEDAGSDPSDDADPDGGDDTDDTGADDTAADDAASDDMGESGGATSTTATLSQECTDALAAVQAAQTTAAEKQDALAAALETLSATLNQAVADLGSSEGSSSGGSAPTASPDSSGGESSGTGSSGAATGGTGSGGTSSGGSASGATGSSASSLASRQAAVDVAAAAVTEAEVALDAATLTAPFAGTVLSVDVTDGGSVGSGDTAVVLVGVGETTVTTTVTADQVARIERGQDAAVTAAGSDEPVGGRVTGIGLLPSTDDSGSTSFPVTIVLDGTVAAPEGSPADVALVTDTEADVLTVPTSAVTTGQQRTTVTVLEDGQPRSVPVTVGAVGTTRTAITDGVDEGDEVVIADLDAPLPSDDDASLQSVDGRSGGFPGGGIGPPAGGAPPGR